MEQVLLDTGPLVALLNRRDQWHKWALETYSALHPPLLTCEAVLSEAWHILPPGPPHESVRRLCSKGVIKMAFNFDQDAEETWQLLRKYADTPMDFADECLVQMSERHPTASVWTIDPHFRFYRKHGREAIRVIMPDLVS